MRSEGVGGWIRRRAATSAQHSAIEFRGAATNYAQLSTRVDGLAAGLRALGVGFGDRVAYLGNNHPSFIESLFATTMLGGIFVPLNTRLSIVELAQLLEHSGSSILISTIELEPKAAAAGAGLSIRRVLVDERGSGATTSASDRDTDAEDYEHVATSTPPTPDLAAEVTLDDRAIIIYTSGTTGRPKGVVLTHGNLTWNALDVLADYDVVSTDRALMISPLFHVASLGMGCLPILMKGATVLLAERFDPAEALASIEQLRATMISGVPTTYQMLMDDPGWATTDLSSMRLLTCGGSAVPDRVREAYESRGLSFSGGYGMTESSPGITMLPSWHSVERSGSAGLPHFFTELRIRRADGQLADAGERGEIETAGPNVFREYWQNDAATREAFTEDGWLRTGDIGYLDGDGFLYIADRLKDMIISGGENIYSAEVELAIATIPGVKGVAVIGVPHERWGEVPHAVVTLADGHQLDPEQMVAYLSSRLARYKVPKTLEVVDELPRTASGKVQKQQLRDRYDSQSSD